MLHSKIIEISTDEETGETYVLVEFWQTRAARGQGERPFLREDFVNMLRLVGERDIDPDDPSKGKETFPRSPRAEIREYIRIYIEEAERLGYAGDNTSRSGKTQDSFSVGSKVIRRKGVRVDKPRARNMSDPHGILSRPEVSNMRGRNIDLE